MPHFPHLLAINVPRWVYRVTKTKRKRVQRIVYKHNSLASSAILAGRGFVTAQESNAKQIEKVPLTNVARMPREKRRQNKRTNSELSQVFKALKRRRMSKNKWERKISGRRWCNVTI